MGIKWFKTFENGPKTIIKWSKNRQKTFVIIFFIFWSSSPFHSYNGPKSLPAGQQIPESNGPMSLHNNNTNWNPFEDMKNFAEMTEDALVDQEFDQLRDNERKKDPFQSAPFAVKQ